MKNSTLFIMESLKQHNLDDWIYAFSAGMVAILNIKNIEIDHRYKVVKTLIARRNTARRTIRALAINEKVDFVYTMAGRAYANFPMYHIEGHAMQKNLINII